MAEERKAQDRFMMSNRRRSVGGIRICAAGNIQSVHVLLGLENDLRHRLGHNHPMGLAARIQAGSWQDGHVTIVFQKIIVLQEDHAEEHFPEDCPAETTVPAPREAGRDR
jgi:hypothetical protein